MVKNENKSCLKLPLNAFISIKGPIILHNCPFLSPCEPDQLIQLSENRGWPTSFQNSLRFGVNTELVNVFQGLHLFPRDSPWQIRWHDRDPRRITLNF